MVEYIRDMKPRIIIIRLLKSIGVGIIAVSYTHLLMYEQGDIDRAYKYLSCSMEDAVACNCLLYTSSGF